MINSQVKEKIVKRMNILDIHTHAPAPRPEAVVCAAPPDLPPREGEQLYSVGIHPWHLAEADEGVWEALRGAAGRSDVVAIGETGIDLTRGLPLFRQMQAFKRHIDLSEAVGKPLVIHDVKAHDIIVGLRKELQPQQAWIIHGFRGKPTVAQMLLRAGCMLSFGEKFNPEALAIVPEEMLLAETDESPLPIESIIGALSASRGADITAAIAANTSSVLGLDR